MELKAKQVENAREGMHADGKGLYLRVQPGGAKSWILRFQLNGKRRAMMQDWSDWCFQPPVVIPNRD